MRSFAIVTTEPNELCAELHNRMPVVLNPEAWPEWLGEEPADEARLKSLLAPYPADGMVCWPVSARVGNVKNNDPGLIEPIAEIAWLCFRERGREQRVGLRLPSHSTRTAMDVPGSASLLPPDVRAFKPLVPELLAA